MEKFLEKFNEILDAEEEVTMDTVLHDVEEWDSLSFVSFLAMANASYGKKLLPGNVKEAETVKDLYDLVK